MKYRLLALDLDGTVLDPYGGLTDGVRRAVAAAVEHGLQVVVCTGRRFRSAVPIVTELGLSGPMVINNGVLVKDIETGTTRHSRYLPASIRAEVIALVRQVGTPLLYVDSRDDTDIFTERIDDAHPFQRSYLADAAPFTVAVDDVAAVGRDDVIMISTMGDEDTLGELRLRGRKCFGDRITTHQIINKNYDGVVVEFLAPGTSKWAGLCEIAKASGIERHEIVAVGDDTNDVDMIRNAGLGIAMGNAVRAVKSAADRVVRSNAEGGAIAAIELAILKS